MAVRGRKNPRRDRERGSQVVRSKNLVTIILIIFKRWHTQGTSGGAISLYEMMDVYSNWVYNLIKIDVIWV